MHFSSLSCVLLTKPYSESNRVLSHKWGYMHLRDTSGAWCTDGTIKLAEQLAAELLCPHKCRMNCHGTEPRHPRFSTAGTYSPKFPGHRKLSTPKLDENPEP